MGQEGVDQGFRGVANLAVFALVLMICAFSAPVAACLCLDEDVLATDAQIAEYDAVFSGLVISTERIDESAFTESFFGVQSG